MSIVLVLGLLFFDEIALADGIALSPPAPLACLARYYKVIPEWQEGAWQVRMDDGHLLPFDDGKDKNFPERLAKPDLEDMFHFPYRRDSFQIPTQENHDPGRIRVAEFFSRIYHIEPGSIVSRHFLGQKIQVHEKLLTEFSKVEHRLQDLLHNAPELRKQLLPLGGTYVRRTIAGTSRASAHSYGMAIDVNPGRSAYWRWSREGSRAKISPSQMPDPRIVNAFETEGFIWGGRWYHFDTMHFEYRPELLDPSCAIVMPVKETSD